MDPGAGDDAQIKLQDPGASIRRGRLRALAQSPSRGRARRRCAANPSDRGRERQDRRDASIGGRTLDL